MNLPELLSFKDGQKVTSDNFEKRRKEIVNILSENEYGITPDKSQGTGKVIFTDEFAYAAKVLHEKVEISFNTPNGIFTFPLNVFIPKQFNKPQMILHIAFRPDIPDKYYPIEEICDNGFATAMFCYKDITDDNNDFSDGLAGMYRQGEKRQDNEWGKIGMWAFAASRALDYLTTRDDIDTSKISVLGHSRLGKTALWAGAQDERFFCAISNDSGCSGDSLARKKNNGGERISDIIRRFPFWFCENYKKFCDNEDSMPFDQHFLLASLAPRYVYICSAEGDSWADPLNQYLSCIAASPAYQLFDKQGFVYNNESLPVCPAELHQGDIGYHIRYGRHFLSRYDWNMCMRFLANR